MPKILLIDDEEELLALTARRLQKKGVHVLVARDLASANVLFAGEGADVHAIVSDLFLGHENGLSFYDEVRAAGFVGPFVLATGDEDGDPRVRALKNSDAHFFCLQKPYALEALIALLETKAAGGF